jgi:hypothetical protein
MFFFISLIMIIIIVIIVLVIYFYSRKDEIQFTDINTGCLYRRFGCCNDKLTPKLDQEGTNCRGF